MMTGRLFFERYPSLLPFILNELRTFISTNDTMMKSNVQAILLLLSRLYIDDHFKGDLTWEVFINNSIFKFRKYESIICGKT